MPKRKHTAEEVINKLREAEVDIASGGAVAEAARRIGVSEQTFYRRRTEYGGFRVEQARRQKQLETENSRLKRVHPKSASLKPASTLQPEKGLTPRIEQPTSNRIQRSPLDQQPEKTEARVSLTRLNPPSSHEPS